MMHLYTLFHKSGTKWSLVKITKPKAENRFREAAMLLFEILKHMILVNVTRFSKFFLPNQT
jgi:hypothetical protein